MGRDQDHPVGLGLDRRCVRATGGHPKGIDARIAGDINRSLRDPLAEQVEPGLRGRGEVDLGQMAGEGPILLLGEGPVRVAGPEPGFDVTERDLSIIRRQRRGQDGRRISLGQDEIRPFRGQDLVEGL